MSKPIPIRAYKLVEKIGVIRLQRSATEAIIGSTQAVKHVKGAWIRKSHRPRSASIRAIKALADLRCILSRVLSRFTMKVFQNEAIVQI